MSKKKKKTKKASVNKCSRIKDLKARQACLKAQEGGGTVGKHDSPWKGTGKKIDQSTD